MQRPLTTQSEQRLEGFHMPVVLLQRVLDNMMGKTGHNNPDLSWHQLLLAVETQNPFCGLR